MGGQHVIYTIITPGKNVPDLVGLVTDRADANGVTVQKCGTKARIIFCSDDETLSSEAITRKYAGTSIETYTSRRDETGRYECIERDYASGCCISRRRWAGEDADSSVTDG